LVVAYLSTLRFPGRSENLAGPALAQRIIGFGLVVTDLHLVTPPPLP